VEGSLLPYLILFAAFTVPAAVAAFRPYGAPRARLILAAIVLTIVIGLRREVGGDWYNYLEIFHRISVLDFAHGLRSTEPGYALLNIIAAHAGWGMWFPNLVCAAIFTWGLVALARMQPNPLLAIAVAIYIITLMGMGYTRQSAALGFVMLAIVQYLRGATLKTFVFLLLAAIFHLSSVIVAPLIGLAVVRRGPIAILLFVVVAVYMYLQLSGAVFQKLDVYTTGTYFAGGAAVRLIVNALPAVIFLSFRNRFSISSEEISLMTIFAITSLLLLAGLLYITSTVILDRVAFYLAPLQLIVLSRIPYAFGGRTRPSMFLLMVVLGYSLALEIGWLTLGTWGSAWIPYRNYLTDWSPPRHREGPRWRQ
jgi:hypothetical protein